jgi:hypothetical protein
MFLFTRPPSGTKNAYYDGWKDDNAHFVYSGEGREGNMQWTPGNKAIRDHAQTGHHLFLFEGKKNKPGGYWRFIGSTLPRPSSSTTYYPDTGYF